MLASFFCCTWTGRLDGLLCPCFAICFHLRLLQYPLESQHNCVAKAMHSYGYGIICFFFLLSLSRLSDSLCRVETRKHRSKHVRRHYYRPLLLAPSPRPPDRLIPTDCASSYPVSFLRFHSVCADPLVFSYCPLQRSAAQTQWFIFDGSNPESGFRPRMTT